MTVGSILKMARFSPEPPLNGKTDDFTKNVGNAGGYEKMYLRDFQVPDSQNPDRA